MRKVLQKTALWQLHRDLKATMGAFAGWDMPMIRDLLLGFVFSRI